MANTLLFCAHSVINFLRGWGNFEFENMIFFPTSPSCSLPIYKRPISSALITVTLFKMTTFQNFDLEVEHWLFLYIHVSSSPLANISDSYSFFFKLPCPSVSRFVSSHLILQLLTRRKRALYS